MLLNHLKICRPKEIAQHAERISICIRPDNSKKFKEVLQERSAMLAVSQKKRIEMLLRKL
jgi:hypothetical protein